MSIQTDFNQDKSILYTDVPLSKELDSDGSLSTIINSDALAQALKIWLVSGSAEKVRSRSGGWLIPYLAKPLNTETAEIIRKNLYTGITNDFKPSLTIVDLQVAPDVKNKRWVIVVKGYSTQFNIGVNTYAVVSTNGA